MIRMKQMADGYGQYGVDFKNPDFMGYANSFGAHGHRLEDPSQFRALLDAAADEGGVHVIDVPIDVKYNVLLMMEMKTVDCSKFNND
jgi:acetolactate synthase-1/2/3 large subunit